MKLNVTIELNVIAVELISIMKFAKSSPLADVVSKLSLDGKDADAVAATDIAY